MFSIIWQLIKLIKHALPFLNEVTNPNDAKDEKDRLIIHNLRALIRTALWRVVMVTIFFVVTLYVVVPLHTENAVLTQENQALEERITYLRDRLESAQRSRDETSKQIIQLETRLMNKESELKNKTDNLEHCYKVGCGPNTTVSQIIESKEKSTNPIKTKPVNPPKPTKPVTKKGETITPKTSSKVEQPGLSDTIQNRLDKIN